MARIAGVNIPTQKRVPIALTYIHGIGRSKAEEICGKCDIPLERRVHEMTDDEVIRVREAIDRDLLRRFVPEFPHPQGRRTGDGDRHGEEIDHRDQGQQQ